MAPYHPASNGQAERAVRKFKESMKVLQDGDIETKLSRLLFNYTITPHSVTGKAPSELLLNRQLRLAFHFLRPDQQLLSPEYQAGVKGGECGSKVRSFQIGDLVWVKNFGSGKKWLPGRIVGKEAW